MAKFMIVMAAAGKSYYCPASGRRVASDGHLVLVRAHKQTPATFSIIRRPTFGRLTSEQMKFAISRPASRPAGRQQVTIVALAEGRPLGGRPNGSDRIAGDAQ